MNKRKIIIVAIAFAIVAIGVLLFKLQTSGDKKIPDSKVFDVARFVNATDALYQDFQSEITAFGRLMPTRKVEIFAEVGGIMLETPLKFKTGNTFSNGDLLIKIDDEETKLTLYSAKSSFMNLLTSSLPDIKADFPQDFDIWNKYLQNFNIEDQIQDLPDIDNDKLKYFLSNRQIFSQYYSIKNSEVRFSKFKIHAPFSGSVILSTVEPGTFIRQGQKIGEISTVGSYELELNVNSSDIAFINIGDNLEISSSEFDKTWNGKIIRIAKNIDQSTQTVKVYASVSGSELREGMYMKALIKGVNIEDAVKVPRKALVNNEFVFTIEDSLLGKSNIQLVKITESDAYIRGIEANKIIITDALADAELGMKVKRIIK